MSIELVDPELSRSRVLALGLVLTRPRPLLGATLSVVCIIELLRLN